MAKNKHGDAACIALQINNRSCAPAAFLSDCGEQFPCPLILYSLHPSHTHTLTHTRGKCIVQRAPINGQLFELMLTTTTTTTTTTALKLDKQRSDQPKTCNNNNNNNIMHSSIASNYNNAAQLTRNTFRLSPLVTKFN